MSTDDVIIWVERQPYALEHKWRAYETSPGRVYFTLHEGSFHECLTAIQNRCAELEIDSEPYVSASNRYRDHDRFQRGGILRRCSE